MWIRQLKISRFRGIGQAEINFGQRQTVLVGPNGAGKSTILEAFALLFGRDRLVRQLTEHDFHGTNPQAQDRIGITATITGFSSNDPDDHAQWFSMNRGVSKWFDLPSGRLFPEQQSESDSLCVQIGFCARFDRTELHVETIRYFHDDDAVIDPFDEEVVRLVPPRLLSELGFFLVPAHRTWDRLVSFNSELFRRILESSGEFVAPAILDERDRLRGDSHRVDLKGLLQQIREGIDAQLKQILPGSPALEFRLTATDTDSLLQALVPHYRYTDSVSLPAGRHGSGLLSLQTALLVLQIAERRRQNKQNVIIAVEEPELHMPPGVQMHVLHQLRNSSDQLLCTTHSPRVAALCASVDIRMMNAARSPETPIVPMLKEPLPTSTKNGIRKLFHENRQTFIEALMHRVVLVPEGRTDAEWLRLFSLCAVTDQELSDRDSPVPFGTVFGVVPTHDACIIDTIQRIQNIRDGILVLTDGDAAGDEYRDSLLQLPRPPELIVQWARGKVMEDVVGWILGQESALISAIRAEIPSAPASSEDIVSWLKTDTRQNGAKTDFLVHEAIANAILSSSPAKARARGVLNAFVDLIGSTSTTTHLQKDLQRSTADTAVWRITLEP